MLFFRSSSGSQGGIEAESFGGSGDPVFVAKGSATADTGSNFLGFRFVAGFDQIGPIAGQGIRAGAEKDRLIASRANGQAAPGPLPSAANQPGSLGIALDIAQERKVIDAALNGKAFIATLIEMADAGGAVGGVPALGVRAGNPFHKQRQVAVMMRPENEVPMVAHQAIAANPHLEAFDSLG